jgi:hypothetical protein
MVHTSFAVVVGPVGCMDGSLDPRRRFDQPPGV